MSTYIIAEVGPNHNGKLDIALALIDMLATIGVNAVKFQLTIPENTYSKDAFKVTYQKQNDQAPTVLEMSKRIQLSFEDHKVLYKRCKEKGVDYLCSAFEIKSLEFLDSHFELPYFKIASGEVFSLDMIDYISTKKRPILLSTGMCSYGEIETCVKLLNRNFPKDITIFHCISAYPAPMVDVNLNNLLEIKKRFKTKIGFSDHTVGNICAIASVAMGATVIEKHVTLDRSMQGPDHKASSTVEEFAQLVKDVRSIEQAMGGLERNFSSTELETKGFARKSCVTKRDLKRGEKLAKTDVVFKRPGTGLSPLLLDQYVGKVLAKDIEIDRVIKAEDFE